ncbi:MAG: hypothetical protein ACNA75_00645 [Thiohalomonadaceae bacterium]
MHKHVTINGKQLRIEITAQAQSALAKRDFPLIAEMELYFSCLVRKQVRFHEVSRDRIVQSVVVDKHLAVQFRPVMTQSCGVDEVTGEEPPVTDFPIANPAAFVPHWLRIDFRNGHWQGEFGYQR